jgi:hypothetical protein
MSGATAGDVVPGAYQRRCGSGRRSSCATDFAARPGRATPGPSRRSSARWPRAARCPKRSRAFRMVPAAVASGDPLPRKRVDHTTLQHSNPPAHLVALVVVGEVTREQRKLIRARTPPAPGTGLTRAPLTLGTPWSSVCRVNGSCARRGAKKPEPTRAGDISSVTWGSAMWAKYASERRTCAGPAASSPPPRTTSAACACLCARDPASLSGSSS